MTAVGVTIPGVRIVGSKADAGQLLVLRSCKAQRLPFTTMPLEFIHGDLVGSIPVRSASRGKYGFVLTDGYSRASSVLHLRARPDGPAKLEVWATKMESGTGSTAKAIMFDDAKELVARRLREYCEHKGIRVNSSVQYSPSSKNARCCAIQTSRRASGQTG